MESGTVDEIFENPKHPYTLGLLKSVPNLYSPNKERLIPIDGTPPDLFAPPTGCPFAARCPFAMEVCVMHMPDTETFSDHHYAKCWLNDNRAIKVEEMITAGSEQLV